MYSTAIRCRQCGANNHSANCLCLACGADLTQPRETSVAPPIAQEEPPLPPPPPVDEPSSLDSAAESNELAEDVRYLFQGEPPAEPSASQPGRYLALILLALAFAVAGWQWRELRTLASRLSSSAAVSQPTATNSYPALTAISSPQTPTPQSVAPAPSELASKQVQTPTAETSSNRSQEGLPAAPQSSKARIQPASQTTPTGNTWEIEGEKYLYGDGVPVNCERAQKDLLAAAKRASAKAENDLGTMYATGHCALRDLPLAYRWFARAQHQDPRLDRKIAQDMSALWDQMSPEERKLATR